MNEYVLPLKRLGLLLNAFYLNGSSTFEVYSPHLQCRLFSIRLEENKPGARITHILDRRLYNTAYEEKTKGDRSLLEEIPDFNYYKFVFLSSGICLPDNWQNQSNEILKSLKHDPLKGQRSVFLSFDTNALIARYYHLVSKMIQKKGIFTKCGYVISKGVIDELNDHEKKYNDPEIDSLGKSLRNHDAWFGFTNQLKLGSRKFKMGFSEFKALTIREHFEETDGEKGDNAIISSLEEFSRNKNVDVMIISEDSEFIEKANTRRLIGIRLDPPRDLQESIIVTWENAVELLYTSSLIYGNLQIKGRVHAKLSGIWKGKKGESWNDEAIRIRTENKDIPKFLDNNIHILNEMNYK